MGVIAWVKGRVRSRLRTLVRAEVQEMMEEMLPMIPQLIEFQNSAKEDRQSYRDHTKDPFGNRALFARLRDTLMAMGVAVEDADIDVSDFEHWLAEFSDIRRHYQSMGDVFIEKCLEHYLAFSY